MYQIYGQMISAQKRMTNQKNILLETTILKF